MNLADNPTFAIWCASLAFLIGKTILLNSNAQAFFRLQSKRFALPEDARFFAKGEATEPHEMVTRFQRVWGNDLENIPFFLVVSLAFVLAGGSEKFTLIYCAMFCVARLLHTITYAMKLQPWRTLVFVVGQGAHIACLVHLLILVFG